MEQVTRRIVGVGYEGHSLPSFLTALATEKIECVVDVRLNAISRRKGFSKRMLTASLAEAGIEYLHLPALGNPKENRDGFWKPGTDLAAHAHTEYRQVLQSEQAVAAMRELLENAATASVALLCFEAREETCHRHLILDELDSFRFAGSPR